VPIPNAEHLLDQAEPLIAPVGPGAPRQVDLRRAISSAYYAVFHAVLAAAADEFVGRARRAETAYGLVYRRIDHGALRELCAELNRPSLAANTNGMSPGPVSARTYRGSPDIWSNCSSEGCPRIATR
jgi:hypothetical protein